ncbi:MAG: aldH [Propionibacteriaceae bacterium]|jgi:NADP-dependent aldehyde dehydrogenase|nr:aldH [Propionibacteriaceae bacterium]
MSDQLEHTTDQVDLESVLEAAASVAAGVARAVPSERAGWLRAIADELDGERDALVQLAQQETRLTQGRLVGELGRTTFQLRLTAHALEEGSWLEATIDHADPDWPTGPRPDLRRMLRGVGPVLVVAASNFPFAFSVAGGDTATALGAGCPVVLKAHPGHPQLSRRTAELVQHALRKAGAPEGVFALIEGESETQQALKDPRIKAGSFTGSVRGGRALFDIAASRPDPIPFYGELGSVNPAFVLPSAIERRRAEVLEGFVGSFTLGAGQFCTKPGVLFVPKTDGLLDELRELVSAVAPAPMLNDRMVSGLQDRLEQMRRQWTVVRDAEADDAGLPPALFATSGSAAMEDLDSLFEEAFGAAAVVVEYDDPAELVEIASQLPGQLTATVQAEEDDGIAPALLDVLSDHAGRILWNGWPTGVSVTWAMQHGGPWPATTASLHTSVGPTALRRFLQPVAFQNLPAAMLPAAVRDDNPLRIWQRVDGKLTSPEEVG